MTAAPHRRPAAGTPASAASRGRGPGGLSRLARLARHLDSPPPAAAIEICASAVAAARARAPRGGARRLSAASFLPLPPGVVEPSLATANVADPAALAAVVRAACERAGGLGREVILLLPDAAARVALLEFDEIPQRAAELHALIRFRLRKTLPFDADAAVISAQVFRDGESRSVLAALADRERVAEYEAAVTAAGARAVVILPAGLAALSAAPEFGHATLLLRLRDRALTSAFAWNEVPRLYRVNVGAPAIGFDDLYPSAAYFRDFCEARAEAAPRIVGYGLAAEDLEHLRAECPWAEVESGAGPALEGEAEAHPALLALAGALGAACGPGSGFKTLGV